MSTSHWRAALLAHLVFFSTSLSSLADTGASGASDDIQRLERGLALAQVHCAACHAIAEADESPTRTNANTSFRDLHQRFPIKMLVEAVSTGTIEGHDEMPAFDFSPAEIIDLLSYIDSLSPDQAGTYVKPTNE